MEEIKIDTKSQKRAEDILRSYNALCLNAKIAKRRVDDINNAMKLLSPDEQLIVQKMLIDPYTNVDFDLCEALHIERSQLYRNRKKAIDKITMALFGCDV